MILSKACEYGIKAVICIAVNSQKGKKVNLKQVAANIESPEAYTSKILQKLAKANLVSSSKGVQGGFYIPETQISDVVLWDVVKEIDGVDISEKCVLGMKNCSNTEPCPVHNKFKHIRSNLVNAMKETAIVELSQGVDSGESVLKNSTKKQNIK